MSPNLFLSDITQGGTPVQFGSSCDPTNHPSQTLSFSLIFHKQLTLCGFPLKYLIGSPPAPLLPFSHINSSWTLERSLPLLFPMAYFNFPKYIMFQLLHKSISFLNFPFFLDHRKCPKRQIFPAGWRLQGKSEVHYSFQGQDLLASGILTAGGGY